MLKLSKNAIDLGIVVRNTDACLDFYQNTLGLELEGEVDMAALGARMYRLKCGDSIIKLVSMNDTPATSNPPGGFTGATGMRYWTIPISNIDEVFASCQKSGHAIPVELRESRPGVRIFIIEDPDGNWVEFVDYE